MKHRLNCLTAAQVLLYNVKKRLPSRNDVKPRHTLQREPPIPIYIGLNVHQMTRSKKLIDQLYRLGISISYDRVTELEEWIGTSVCEQFEKDGIVAPTGLRKGLFTVCAQDNIDHNPTSTTAVNAFMALESPFSNFQLRKTLVKTDLLLHYHLLEPNSISYRMVMPWSQL